MRQLTLPETLGQEPLRELRDELARSTEPVVLRGVCAGADLSADLGHDEGWQLLREVFVAMRHGPPIVAVVTGPVQGGGVGLVAACDVVLATDAASFALTELLFGLIPGAIAPALIGRIGAAGVRRLALRASPMAFEEAMACGLVDHPAHDERRVLQHLARLDPDAVRALRTLVQPGYFEQVDAGIAQSKGRIPAAEPRLRKWADGEAPWSK